MPPSLSLDVPSELIKDPRSWTLEDIGLWLHWLGIGEHAEVFAAQGVDGRALLQLSAEAAWADLGVIDPAQQRVLDSAVEPLRFFRDGDGPESSLALHAIEGPVAGEVFLLGPGGITGGRHCASNGIVLSENYVSRRHFQISRDRGGQFLLQDVGSTTGTFLMVREEVVLEHQMVLQLGTTELTVFLDGDCCSLVATEGPDKDARATVPLQGLFIGRDSSNGLCIRDPQISAFHCEVRFLPEQGYILDDKYSTNRTWLRLAPDGQPSKRFHLRVDDLFKVGSTLFHVVDPASMINGEAIQGGDSASSSRPRGAPSTYVSMRPHPVAADMGLANLQEDLDMSLEDESAALQALADRLGALESRGDAADRPQLRWEPFLDGDPRPVLAPEEYARQLTASRQQMQSTGLGRRGAATSSEMQASQDDGMRQRELSSLQQRMRNSRAQTAYSLQQQRSSERRDEDLCKICYDHDIDVVLYPCGHFVLCRMCAQKVSDCPVCRFVITDVIRTYKA